jgi:hypothetical protein
MHRVNLCVDCFFLVPAVSNHRRSLSDWRCVGQARLAPRALAARPHHFFLFFVLRLVILVVFTSLLVFVLTRIRHRVFADCCLDQRARGRAALRTGRRDRHSLSESGAAGRRRAEPIGTRRRRRVLRARAAVWDGCCHCHGRHLCCCDNVVWQYRFLVFIHLLVGRRRLCISCITFGTHTFRVLRVLAAAASAARVHGASGAASRGRSRTRRVAAQKGRAAHAVRGTPPCFTRRAHSGGVAVSHYAPPQSQGTISISV